MKGTGCQPVVWRMAKPRHRDGTRLFEPQRFDGRLMRKLVPTAVLLATRCGSQTRAPATPESGARLYEPQRVDGIGTSKLVPTAALLATRCG